VGGVSRGLRSGDEGSFDCVELFAATGLEAERAGEEAFVSVAADAMEVWEAEDVGTAAEEETGGEMSASGWEAEAAGGSDVGAGDRPLAVDSTIGTSSATSGAAAGAEVGGEVEGCSSLAVSGPAPARSTGPVAPSAEARSSALTGAASSFEAAETE